MRKYSYTGKNLSGIQFDGIARAKDTEDLESKLAEKDIILEKCSPKSSLFFSVLSGWTKKSEITRLTRQMAVLISSGISVLDAVESIREQIDDKQLGNAYDIIIQSIQSGERLHQAFGQFPEYFDSLYLSLLESGELSGTLDVSLERIASYRERSESVSKKIKTAMAYPSLVLLVSFGVIFVLIAYIIPIFSSMYAGFGLELPDLTLKIVSLSEFIKNFFGYLVIGFLILALLLLLISRTDKFKVFLGAVLLKLPIIKNLAIKLATARFGRTLGTLLLSGLQLIDAISVARKTVGNKYIERKLEIMPDSLAQGQSLAKTLADAKVFPKTVIRMTAAGESTGRLGEMFSKSADFYESEIDNEITAMTSIIEPVIIIVLGVIIAFILIAMYLPLFDLMGQLGP